MKNYHFLLTGLLALAPASAEAVLGKTAEECRKQYGTPTWGASTNHVRPPARVKYYFRWHGCQAEASFVGRDVADSRCVSVTYRYHWADNHPVKELTAADIDSLLSLNAGGSSWEKAPGGWKRKDGRAFAKEYKATHDASAWNQLYVFDAAFDPIVAAMITADLPLK